MGSSGKPIHLCVPTLKRYDLLVRLLKSAEASTLPVTKAWIIDNGGKLDPLWWSLPFQWHVEQPLGAPWGLAESWNWFLREVPEERIIVNDDIVLAPGSLAEMVRPAGHMVSALAGSNAFSCFLIRDSLVEKIGYFDESISPGYAYFEDNDYAFRMAAENIPIQSVSAGVEHVHSQTIATYTPEEWQEHHRKFDRAKENFRAKWGRLPGEAR